MSPRKLHAPDLCSFRIEEDLGFPSIFGLDEVGRGCIAGPLVVAAVCFPASVRKSDLEALREIRDSKKLSEAKRESLYSFIKETAEVAEVREVSVQDIDQLNVLRACLRGFRDLMSDIKRKFSKPIDMILVDGNQPIPNLNLPQRCIVKGDSFSKSIAAASILAKVHRDRLMKSLAKDYPQYKFELHKGYGTRAHWQALHQYGPCALHRQSFLGRKLRLKLGKQAESQVSAYLKTQGFEILHRNWTCKLGEIDIIAKKDGKFHLFEVRKRENLNLELGFPNEKREKLRKLAAAYASGLDPDTEIRSHFFSVVGGKIFPEWDVFKL